MPTNKPIPTDATRISFRLPPEVAAELADRAGRAGKSPNLVVRDLVADAMRKPAGHAPGESADARAVASDTAPSREQFDVLLGQVKALHDALTAANERQRGLEDVCHEHLVGTRDDTQAADKQRLAILEKFTAEIASIRSALSVLDRQLGYLTAIRAELVVITEDTKHVRKLRGDLASSVNVLLVNAGKLTPEQAKAWVQKTTAVNI